MSWIITLTHPVYLLAVKCSTYAMTMFNNVIDSTHIHTLIIYINISGFTSISSHTIYRWLVKTLNILNLFQRLQNMNTHFNLSWMWPNPSRWNEFWNNNTCCPSYAAKITPADVLTTLWSRASAGMVLAPQSGIFRLQHHRSFNELWYLQYTCIGYDT